MAHDTETDSPVEVQEKDAEQIRANQAEKFRAETVKQITSDIKSLRGWLDYLERDISTHHKGVIHALILTSINESCMKLVYNAGMFNGDALNK